MPIQIAQSSTPVGPGHWRWSVWLEGPAPELDGLDHVVYTLHSTFSEPVRVVHDRASAFRLDSSGWGEFDLHAALHHRDGRVDKLKHWLVLGTGDGTLAPDKGPRGEEGTRIYLSYGVADAATGHTVKELLGKEPGVMVTTSDELADVATGVPFERLIENQLRNASRAVFLVSHHPSPWLRREAEVAQSLGVPSVFVRIDDAPSPLAKGSLVASLRVNMLEPGNAADVAQAITRWAAQGEEMV